MKFLDKLALVLFSMIILIISIITCLTIFGWVNLATINLLFTDVLANKVTCNVLLGVNVIFILLALKALFFGSVSKGEEKYNDGILLENDDGKLLITKETLISMINAVVAGFEGAKNCQTSVHLDIENNLSIVLTIEATSNTIIKELSNNLQIKIKEKIKESLDLDVTSINIRIKNIVESKAENINI